MPVNMTNAASAATPLKRGVNENPGIHSFINLLIYQGEGQQIYRTATVLTVFGRKDAYPGIRTCSRGSPKSVIIRKNTVKNSRNCWR